MTDEDRGLAFDRVAEDYDRARPDYPDELVDAACRIGGLGAGSRVLEIGCGTGKLTRALVERGLAVEAVDPGTALIEVARRHVGDGARFRLGRFEDVELPDAAYDAVFSAAAFHWIDPAIGWRKVARVLRPGGLLALLGHVGRPDHEFEDVWASVAPEAADGPRHDPQALLERPEAAELFDDVAVEQVELEFEQTFEQTMAIVRTWSAYIVLDRERQRRLEAAVEPLFAGGVRRWTVFAVLVTARSR